MSPKGELIGSYRNPFEIPATVIAFLNNSSVKLNIPGFAVAPRFYVNGVIRWSFRPCLIRG